MKFVWALLLVVLLLSGCGGNGDSPQPNIQIPLEPPSLSSRLVPIHEGVLRGEPYQVLEAGIETMAVLTAPAFIGDISVSASPTAGYVPGQLLTYTSSAGESFSAIVDSVSADTISFKDQIEADIEAGGSIYNFYFNPRHPNRFGYKAIADFAARELGVWDQAGKVHVLFGDSWLSNGVIRDRFAVLWPTETFINSGVIGDTVQDLISRFDVDVAPLQPDFVWVVVGTNDYSHAVPTTSFFWDMQQLVSMIRGIGAEAIIFDPSVGPLEYGVYLNGELKAASDEYAAVLQSLSF